ncbi:AAA family ATPase [Bacillus cereus]|uniref:AAA family ATPase n=1 Tax=Bacillus cereus TaxID=1396 RepID=UPI003CF17921
MDKIRIKNLRSLQDTGEIEIKPLTLLVGKNSSGKSTFLRFFPLLKQTLETRTNEPILWYSSRYVDFGSFQESLNFNKKGETIGFQFDFKIPQAYMKFGMPNKNPWRVGRYGQRFNKLAKKEFSFKVDIECAEKFIKSVYIEFEDHTIDIEFKSKERISKLKINNMEYINEPCIPIYLRDSSSILPSILFIEEEGSQNTRRIKDVHSTEEIFSDNIFQIFKKFAFGNTSNDTIRDAIDRIALGSSEDIFNSLNKLELKAKKLSEGIKKIRMEDKIFEEIKCNLIGIYLNDIISTCNKYFELDFSSINYIAPLRASAERYYRIQGLSVDEIDPQGTNIPMMIHNMTNKEKQSFISWTKENFNFEIITTLEGGHTSLKLKYNNDSEVINLADTGFGYSQLLPIMIVMWQAINKNLNNQMKKEPRTFRSILAKFEQSMHTIVIEQPELHLHPALQAKLIDTFVQIIMKSQEMNINIKIIIETHSETMLNRIGYLIAKKKFNVHNSLVNVVVFDKKDTYESDISISGYNERGQLLSWPIGFFSPEDF